MAAIDPILRDQRTLETLYRHGARIAAVSAYAAAVVTAYLLLAPVLPSAGSATAGSATAILPASAPAITYTVRPGDTVELIAARNGLSLAELFAFNPQLEPLGLEPKTTVRVGKRT